VRAAAHSALCARLVVCPFPLSLFAPIPLPQTLTPDRPLRAPVPQRTPSPKPPFSTDPAGIEVER